MSNNNSWFYLFTLLVLIFNAPVYSQDKTRSSFIETNLSGERLCSLQRRVYAEKEASVAAILQSRINSSTNDFSNRAFGEIPLEESISPSGARTYSISIPTASGLHMVPEVSLSYNSQATEGWAGYGWDIQGISTITLISKNKYYHGVAKGANVFDSSPAFALDGVPLVQNTQPETMSSYPLITATGNILAAPVINHFNCVSAFNVVYPNGARAVFGFGHDIAYNMPSYPLTEITDIDGNKITYSYLEDQTNANNRLNSIQYGYDSPTHYQCIITFNYSSLTQYVSRYYAGRSQYRAYRLDSIVSTKSVFTESDGDATYSWEERTINAYDTDYHLLSSAQYVGRNGSDFTPFNPPVPDTLLLRVHPGFVYADNLVSTTRRTYDSHGNVTSEKTAPYGASTFTGDTLVYDSNGRYLVSKTDALGRTTTYSGYNKFGKPTTVPDGKWLQKVYTYSTGSVLASIAYTSQSGYITTETYIYSNGHNTGITLPNNVTVWSLTSENDLGQPTAITTGSITRQYGYTPYGLPTYRKMNNGALQDFSYQFDPLTGNLLQRSGYLSAGTESFGYDALNRLVSMTDGTTTRQIVYTDNGNITSIDGVGTLVYGGGTGVSPYEVTGLVPEQGQPAYRQRTVTYNSFDRPASVSEGDYTATFTYNASENKVLTQVDELGTGTHLKRYYVSDCYEYELEPITPTERLYLGGDAYSAPMVLQRTGANGTWTLYDIGRDYLGSITDIVDNDNTSSAYHYRYDPWGKLIYYSRVQPFLIGRGYTGHEHLPWFGLINANARLYDPLLGRFLSPDPYVQDPDFTQNYNRYSYCLNNPLKYTDESGNSPGLTVTAIWSLPQFIREGLLKSFNYLASGDFDLAGETIQDAWSNYQKRLNNAVLIDNGLYQVDTNLSEEEQAMMLMSRFDSERMQTNLGYWVSIVFNNLYEVDVHYYHGATLINSYVPGHSGVTLGPYINGKNLIADAEYDAVFAHEYGHTVQSRQLGSNYLFAVGAPSLISAWLHTKGLVNHYHQWYEVQANHLSADYFSSLGMPKVRTKLEGSANLSMTFFPDWYYYVSGSFIWANMFFHY